MRTSHRVVALAAAVAGVAVLVAAVVLVGVLAGVGGPAHPARTPSPSLTVVPTPTSGPAVDTSTPLATASNEEYSFAVYPVKALRATQGCGCKVSTTAVQEEYPKGTPVVVLRVVMRGNWSLAHPDSHDATGMSLAGTTWSGWPGLAVTAAKGGQAAAVKAGIPWQPAGAFAGHAAWTLQNQQYVSFAVAYYIPQGVDTLQIAIHTPGDTDVDLPALLPASVAAMTLPGKESE